MDDTDYKKQRSSLILISIAIILYILGDGEIGTKGGVFGGTIIFGKPEILEYAGLVIYLWLNWRYILSSKSLIKRFGSHFGCLLYQSKRLIPRMSVKVKKIRNLFTVAVYCDWHLGYRIQFNLHCNPPLMYVHYS